MSKRVLRTNKNRNLQGFSMVELMLAMFVLGTAILGSAAMIMLGLSRNAGIRMDTEASNVAETFLEDIASALPNGSPVLTLTDCNNVAWAVNTTGPGSTLTATGGIDFTQPKVAGYQADYVVCTANGLQVKYDVRWAVIQPAGDPGWAWTKQVIVAAQQPLNLNKGKIFYTPPVTLRTVVGMPPSN
jgi:Tfp pilus assembly protein PilV